MTDRTLAVDASAVLEAVLQSRFSCRKFLRESVPRAELERILAGAQRTASWCNAQPWSVHMLSGQALADLSHALLVAAEQGLASSDLAPPSAYRGRYGERRRASGYALYDALGIGRGDREARWAQAMENYRFFGAPHAAIITSDRDLGVYGAVDCGGYVTNLVNLAAAAGVASCPQAAIAMLSDVVREVLRLPDDRVVVCAVALGYADHRHPANSWRTDRADLTETVTWLSDRKPLDDEETP